jgi:DNA-directed RNA polymerase subunit RPC12/RpoP
MQSIHREQLFRKELAENEGEESMKCFTCKKEFPDPEPDVYEETIITITSMNCRECMELKT